MENVSKVTVTALFAAAAWFANTFQEEFARDFLFPGIDTQIIVSMDGNKVNISHGTGGLDCVRFELSLENVESFSTRPVVTLPNMVDLQIETTGNRIRVRSASTDTFRWLAGDSIVVDCNDVDGGTPVPGEWIVYCETDEESNGKDSPGLQQQRWLWIGSIWFCIVAAAVMGLVVALKKEKKEKTNPDQAIGPAQELIDGRIQFIDCLEALILKVETKGREDETKIMQGLMRGVLIEHKTASEAIDVEIKRGPSPGKVRELWPPALRSFKISLGSAVAEIHDLNKRLDAVEIS